MKVDFNGFRQRIFDAFNDVVDLVDDNRDKDEIKDALYDLRQLLISLACIEDRENGEYTVMIKDGLLRDIELK